MLKWPLAVIGVALVADFLLGDPLNLHRIDFNGIYQDVRNIAHHIANAEYSQILSSDLSGKR
jgi:hypothetical protein